MIINKFELMPTSSVSTILNENSWAVISEVAQAGTGDTYWDIGDRKAITLNGNIGSYLTLSNKTLYVFILDFNHPVNKTTADNNIIFGGFKTALSGGVDVCLCDSKYNTAQTSGICFNINHRQKDTDVYNTNYGGWKGCDFRYDILGVVETAPSPYNRAKTNNTSGSNATTAAITSPKANTLMAALPSDFRSVLRLWTRRVDNLGRGSNIDSSVSACVDAGISLLTEFEVQGGNTFANKYEQNHQKQMAYYSAGNSKIKYKHNATSTKAYWWSSSPSRMNQYCFCCAHAQVEGVRQSDSQDSMGLAPAFKV